MDTTTAEQETQATTTTANPGRLNSVPTEDRSIGGLADMLAKGIKTETKPPLISENVAEVVENIANGLKNGGAEEIKLEAITADPVSKTEEILNTAATAVAEAPASAATIVEEVKIEPNHWDNTEDTTSEQEKKPEIKAGIDVKEFEQKSQELEEIKQDKLINAYLSAKKAGKDVSTFLSEIQGTDPNRLTPEQLYEIDLKAEGLNEDQVKEEMETFRAQSPFAQIKQTKETKARLIKEREERFAHYANSNQASQVKMIEIGQRALTEKQQYLDSQKGKKVMGIEMTPTLLNELSDYYDNFNIQREDKSINVSEIMQIGLLRLKSKVMLQNAYNKGRTDFELEQNKKLTRPSKDSGIAMVPQQKNQSKQSESQANMASFDAEVTKGRGGSMRTS